MAQNKKRTWGLILSTLLFIVLIAGYYGFRLYLEAPKDAFVATANSYRNDLDRSGGKMNEALKEVDSNGLSKAVAVIQTARGKIKFKFYTNDAPKTVARIAELIQNGFYNGIIFHRVEPQFVIQGGDPTGTGTSGSGVKLPAEFNSRKHVAGTVAMARTQDPNSADSQFYICLGTHAFLDGKYTVFGQVIEGQEVANQIRVGDRMTSVTLEY